MWAASEGAQHPLCTRGSQPVRVRAQPAACDPAAIPTITSAVAATITTAVTVTTATTTVAAAAIDAVAARRDLCSSAGTMLVLKAPGRQAEP